MSHTALVRIGNLDPGLILAPERYDPRRISAREGLPLVELADFRGPALSTKKMKTGQRYLVLDTGDAAAGFLRPRSGPVDATEVKSAKKLVRSGDVIISRLRPYLRQVALVDKGLIAAARDAPVIVSTEFYVLRPKEDGRSIAFLVPFLLSSPIQEILAASQEGGHHPRFNKETLLSLSIPNHIVKARDIISSSTLDAVEQIRSSGDKIAELIGSCGLA